MYKILVDFVALLGKKFYWRWGATPFIYSGDFTGIRLNEEGKIIFTFSKIEVKDDDRVIRHYDSGEFRFESRHADPYSMWLIATWVNHAGNGIRIYYPQG